MFSCTVNPVAQFPPSAIIRMRACTRSRSLIGSRKPFRSNKRLMISAVIRPHCTCQDESGRLPRFSSSFTACGGGGPRKAVRVTRCHKVAVLLNGGMLPDAEPHKQQFALRGSRIQGHLLTTKKVQFFTKPFESEPVVRPRIKELRVFSDLTLQVCTLTQMKPELSDKH